MAVLDSVKRKGLIAGDYPTKTEAITVPGPAEFMRGDVLGLIGGFDGRTFALADSSKSDGSETPVGIMCDDVTVNQGEEAAANMYVKGEFNGRHLRFGGDDTADTHKRQMTAKGLLVRETKAEGGAH